MEVRTDFKPERAKTPKRRTESDRDASLRFKVVVCSEPCLLTLWVPGHVCPDELQAAHCIPKRTLKKLGLGHLVWDPANGVCLDTDAHTGHDLGHRKIPREWLPARCHEFAARHRLTHVLERHWPALATTGSARLQDSDAAHQLTHVLERAWPSSSLEATADAFAVAGQGQPSTKEA